MRSSLASADDGGGVTWNSTFSKTQEFNITSTTVRLQSRSEETNPEITQCAGSSFDHCIAPLMLSRNPEKELRGLLLTKLLL